MKLDMVHTPTNHERIGPRRSHLNSGTLMLVLFVLAAMPAVTMAGGVDPADLFEAPWRDTTRPGPNREAKAAMRTYAAALTMARGFAKSHAAVLSPMTVHPVRLIPVDQSQPVMQPPPIRAIGVVISMLDLPPPVR